MKRARSLRRQCVPSRDTRVGGTCDGEGRGRFDGTEHAVRTRLKPWKWSAGAPNVTVWNSRHSFGSRPSCMNQTHPAHAPRTRASTRAHERTLANNQTNTRTQSRSQTNKQTNKQTRTRPRRAATPFVPASAPARAGPAPRPAPARPRGACASAGRGSLSARTPTPAMTPVTSQRGPGGRQARRSGTQEYSRRTGLARLAQPSPLRDRGD